MNRFLLLCLLCVKLQVYSQFFNPNKVEKWLTIQDTLRLENTSVSPNNFKLYDAEGKQVSKETYVFDATNAFVFLKPILKDSVKVTYYKYPNFLTKTYSPFDKSYLIDSHNRGFKKYTLDPNAKKKVDFFYGLNTNGNITRGISVGNNQGSVLNSGLDLQIDGKLSQNLYLRANINDSSIPLQENGVSQNINEFDRVFVELYTNKWKLRAGDIDLIQNDSRFLSFTKKISGVSLTVNPEKEEDKLHVVASGAITRGQFLRQNITAIEGNQGPYQLLGPNNQQNSIVISGSEKVYVNGILKNRGEQKDYTIDYNLGTLVFNPTFPINATHRIIVEFQFNDNNYNRFVSHNGVSYETDGYKIAGYFYNENDIKNQSSGQVLTDEQKKVLSKAGNDISKMIAPNASRASFDENRIQYEQDENGNFVFSTDQNAVLYNVNFSLATGGAYNLKSNTAIGRVYEFVGEGNGSFAPVIQLVAPVKKQVAMTQGSFWLNDNTEFSSELAISNNDLNLFSDIDDQSNKAGAGTFAWKQKGKLKDFDLDNHFQTDFIQNNFNTVENQRIYNVEFVRDWNLNTQSGNQLYINNEFSLRKDSLQEYKAKLSYLNFKDNYKGVRSELSSKTQFKNAILTSQTSFVSNKATVSEGRFLRNNTKYSIYTNNKWLGLRFTTENNKQTNKQTQVLENESQRFLRPGIEIGIGDSLKAYHKLFYDFTTTDSIVVNKFENVQKAQNVGLQSRWIQTYTTRLSSFFNYRHLDNVFRENTSNFNSRINYQQSFFKNIIRSNTRFETNSGTTTLQEFTYIETEPGQGFYTYLGDLNNNNLRDFDEFEVAVFQDQANFLRVLLPNRQLISSQKNRINQSLWIDFRSLKNKDRESHWLSHLSNQSIYLLENEVQKQNNKLLTNPFEQVNENTLFYRQSITNNLFFNRGLQNFSTTFTYQDVMSLANVNLDAQEQSLKSYTLGFIHNLEHSWLLGLQLSNNTNESISNQFRSRNFRIVSNEMQPKIALLRENKKLELSYVYQEKNNDLGLEKLNASQWGLSYEFNKLSKVSIISEFKYINNRFQGDAQSPAAFQILESLEDGVNYTWSLIAQKKLSQLLDLNLTYNGRKTPSSNVIHTGSIQLRANF